MSYASYKFHKAVRSLALASGHKKEWLTSEYVSRILMLNAHDLPEPVRADFRQFQRDMTSTPGMSLKDAHRATVRAMSESEVIKMILRILSMHDAIKCHGQPFDTRYNFPVNRDMRDEAA